MFKVTIPEDSTDFTLQVTQPSYRICKNNHVYSYCDLIIAKDTEDSTSKFRYEHIDSIGGFEQSTSIDCKSLEAGTYIVYIDYFYRNDIRMYNLSSSSSCQV